MNNKLSVILKEGKSLLKENKISEYALDAEVLIMFLLKIDRAELYLKFDSILKAREVSDYQKLLRIRISGMPVQYIIGKCEFMSLEFNINKNVLIPRPETETLTETIIGYVKTENIKNMLDIGCGSGCISISIAYYTGIGVTAMDISDEALAVAKENSRLNNVEGKTGFYLGDIFDGLPPEYDAYFDAVVSNPPYIPTEEIESLMDEVKGHEPFYALDGGRDGLEFYREIIKNNKYLKSGGFIFFEIGHNQSEEIYNMLLEANFNNINTVKDLSGIKRIMCARKSIDFGEV